GRHAQAAGGRFHDAPAPAGDPGDEIGSRLGEEPRASGPLASGVVRAQLALLCPLRGDRLLLSRLPARTHQPSRRQGVRLRAEPRGHHLLLAGAADRKAARDGGQGPRRRRDLGTGPSGDPRRFRSPAPAPEARRLQPLERVAGLGPRAADARGRLTVVDRYVSRRFLGFFLLVLLSASALYEIVEAQGLMEAISEEHQPM